jgi:tetratricopeptide (TPR) repeat protein
MDDLFINSLLENLKNSEEKVRAHATQELWRMWFQQKGMYGFELLERSQVLLELGAIESAEDLLSQLTQDQPDFAEAWNRRAVLYYMKGEYWKAIADCKKVIDLVPIHFGALHGLGLCYAAIGRYPDAIKTFRRALEIQPYSLENQKLILECTARLS